MSSKQTVQKEIKEIEEAGRQGDNEAIRQKITGLTARVTAELSSQKVEAEEKEEKTAGETLAQKIQKIQDENK